jgi:hypothetical protein
MLAVNEVGTKGKPGEIVDDGDGGSAQFIGHVTEFGAIRDGSMAAILQSERDVAHIEFAARAAGEGVVRDEDAHAGSGLVLFDMVPHGAGQRQQMFAQTDHVLVVAGRFLLFAIGFVEGKFVFGGLEAGAIVHGTEPFSGEGVHAKLTDGFVQLVQQFRIPVRSGEFPFKRGGIEGKLDGVVAVFDGAFIGPAGEEKIVIGDFATAAAAGQFDGGADQIAAEVVGGVVAFQGVARDVINLRGDEGIDEFVNQGEEGVMLPAEDRGIDGGIGEAAVDGAGSGAGLREDF